MFNQARCFSPAMSSLRILRYGSAFMMLIISAACLSAEFGAGTVQPTEAARQALEIYSRACARLDQDDSMRALLQRIETRLAGTRHWQEYRRIKAEVEANARSIMAECWAESDPRRAGLKAEQRRAFSNAIEQLSRSLDSASPR